MSIIFRQTLKSSIYSYVGAIIGFVTVGYLLPKYLSPAEIGVTRTIQYYSVLIASILSFGIPQSIIRMFPYFENSKNKNHGFLTLILLILLVGILIFMGVFEFGSSILFQEDFKSELFNKYYHLILPFTIAGVLFLFLDNYATALKESTIGVFSKDFALRLSIIILIGLYIYSPSFGYHNYIIGFAYVQFIPIIILILFLLKKGYGSLTTNISFPSNRIKSEFIAVSVFSWVNVIGSNAIISIDSIMLSKFIDQSAVGIYTTVFSFASLMSIPIRSLLKITKPIVAEHFKNDNIDAIDPIYKKSALNPQIIGTYMLGAILFSTPIIFNFILRPEYKIGFWVLIIFGVSNLINMSTGIKYIVIANSKYYKWTTVFLIGLVVLIISTNIIFIPKFGITGAAIASLISNFIYQISGLIFVKYKLGLWPFSKKTLQLLVSSFLLISLLYIIPNFGNEILFSFIKIGVFTVIYIGYVIYSNISTDITDQLLKLKRNLIK